MAGNARSEVVSSIRREGDALIASMHGEIDLHNSPQVRSALLRSLDEKKTSKLVLNLSQVPYMDSSAIAVLVEALQRLRKTGGKIFLVDVQPRVKGLLEIARLDTIFSIVGSEADALHGENRNPK